MSENACHRRNQVKDRTSVYTVDLIRAAGGEAIFVPTDVAIPADVEGLINTTVETYGRIDFACNNADVLGDLCPMVAWSRSSRLSSLPSWERGRG